MIRSSLLLAATVLAACCSAPFMAAAQAPPPATPDPTPAADAPPRSTSDTLEYCDHLAKRFNAVLKSRPGHPRAEVIAGEGRHLCRQGHMRPGILRLRRALMLLDAPPEEQE